MKKYISLETKKAVVEYYNATKSIEKTRKKFGVGQVSIFRWKKEIEVPTNIFLDIDKIKAKKFEELSDEQLRLYYDFLIYMKKGIKNAK